MAEVELGPSELDRLEDALEALEHDGALEHWLEDEPSPQVRERLADYRSILAVSREALPLEDVARGVLDGVLEQARQAAAAAPVAAAASEGTWWSRVRRTFMVPVLALAGTAALVLWVFDPADQAMRTPPSPTSASTPAASAPAAEKEDARYREAPEADERSEAEPEPIDASPAAQPVTPASSLDEGAADAGDRAGVETKRDADKDAKPGAPGTMGSLGDAPGRSAGGKSADVQQKQAGGAAGSASGRWDLVSRGDRARQAGDCVAAREEYALALEDDEARVRARALAGLGLCDAQAGDEASADANYERARELDGEIGSFIDSQRKRSRPSSKRKSAPKKSKMAMDDVLDPYSP